MPISPDRVRELADDAGFDLVRFGPADPGPHGARFTAWLDAGRHGSMSYLERNAPRILDPQKWRQGVRSAIAVGVDYSGPNVEFAGGGRVARYAVGRDYHRWLQRRIVRLRDRLEQEGLPRGSMAGGTDAVPVLERALAVRAGIGFLAKSAMVISPTHGPYLQLGQLLTGLDLPPDGPSTGSCGTCTACLDACPTQAITAPHEVDSRLCLSYTTIELRGFAAPELRQQQGDRLFGCDVCLEVCPFQSKSPLLNIAGRDRPADLQPHRVIETWTLTDILAMSQEQYDTEWTGTAMRRATRSGLRRNAAVVLGNLGDPQSLGPLTASLADPDPIVRGHAAWAIGRIDARHPALDKARHSETDPDVTHEIQLAQGGPNPSR